MLVLSRKVNQRIQIGGDVTITLVRIKGDGSVQIGIEAPKTVKIMRTEIIHRDTMGEIADRCDPGEQ